MSTLKQRFAKLKELRPDVSQADLARATGAKPPSVNAWFTGETKSMKAATAAKAAALYGVNPLWLAEGAGDMLASGANLTVPMPTIQAGNVVPITKISVRDAVMALGQALAGRDVEMELTPASSLLKTLALQPDRASEVADRLEGLLGGRRLRAAPVQPKSVVKPSARIYQFSVRTVTKRAVNQGFYESHIRGGGDVIHAETREGVMLR